MKIVRIPYPNVEKIILPSGCQEEHGVVDGEFECDICAEVVIATPDLSAPGRGAQWTVRETEPLESKELPPINVGKGKAKR